MQEFTQMPEDSVLIIPVNSRPVQVCVSLVISGDNVDPDSVSAVLALSAERSYKKGQVVPPSKIARKNGLWLLSSGSQSGVMDMYSQFMWLLQIIEGKQVQLAEIASKGHYVKLVCRFGIAHWNTAVEFPPDLLSRLSVMQIPLVFDIYDEQSDLEEV